MNTDLHDRDPATDHHRASACARPARARAVRASRLRLGRNTALARAARSGGGRIAPWLLGRCRCRRERHRDARLLEGQRLGQYRIVRKLGSGGMGDVYLAERADEEYQQRVAIKLVRGGLYSPQVQSRLRMERQILATLAASEHRAAARRRASAGRHALPGHGVHRRRADRHVLRPASAAARGAPAAGPHGVFGACTTRTRT